MPFILVFTGCNSDKIKNEETAVEATKRVKDFSIVDIPNYKIVRKRDPIGDIGYQLVSDGYVQNNSAENVNSYRFDIGFRLYSLKGKTVEIDFDESILVFDHGFENRRLKDFALKPWQPGQILTFKTNDYLSEDDFAIPVGKVEVVYRLIAKNSFDYRFDDFVGSYDITAQWKIVQSKILKP